MANRTTLEFSGNWFEQKIERRLAAEFPESRLIHDCHIYSQYLGRNTQIDLIMLFSGGICIIEAKNWGKYLKGGYDDLHWTGMASDPIVKTIVNPIDQNFVHIRALKNALRRAGYQPKRFESFVCVPDSTSIFSSCSEMCSLSQLIQRLRILARQASWLDTEYWEHAIRGVCL